MVLLKTSFSIYIFAFISYSQSFNDDSNIAIDNIFSNLTARQRLRKPVTLSDCGLTRVAQPVIGSKIVGGKQARIGEFPWQTLLKIYDQSGRPVQCGGSIINSRWILTAAHCVSDERSGRPFAQSIEVTAGILNRRYESGTAQKRYADCVIQHQSWRGSAGQFRNDLALIRISAKNPFEMTYNRDGSVNSVCFPPKTSPFFEFSGKARISGWGLTRDKGQPAENMMYTDVSIIDTRSCRAYEYPVAISESMICQGVERTAPCQGDSGGPLIIHSYDKADRAKAVQIGVVSFGPGVCANNRIPSAIYTKISHFMDWIESTIASNDGSVCNQRSLRLPTIKEQQQQQQQEEQQQQEQQQEQEIQQNETV